MPKSETTTLIPIHEEMKHHWANLMFAADAILTAWEGGDSGLPRYIQDLSDAVTPSHTEPHVVLHGNLQAVLCEFPDRDFNPALKFLITNLGSECLMSAFSPEQKVAFIRDAAIQATHVVYHLHLKAFRVMRTCGQLERGEVVETAVEKEMAEYEQLLDKLLPRRA